jgi:hypothetical protein
MKSDSDLAQVMAALAAEHRSVSSPYSVERAVLAEFEAARRRRIWKIAAAGAVAALLAAGVFGIRERPGRQPSVSANAVLSTNAVPPVASRAAAPAATDETMKPKATRRLPRGRPSAPREKAPAPAPQDSFVAIPYTVPLAPEERATIVRMTLSPAAIAAVGFPFAVAETGSALQADVLVGEDGRARAFRIVADSSFR